MAERDESGRRFTLPISVVLVAGFGGLILVAVGLVLFMGFYSASRTTESYFQAQTEAFLDQLVGALDTQLQSIGRRADWVGRQVRSGKLDPRRLESWDTLAEGFLVEDMHLAGTEGMAVVSIDGKLRIYRTRGTRIQKEVYQRHPAMAEIEALIARLGMKEGASRWNDPILGEGRQQAVVTLLTPLFREGELLGALIQGVTVAALSDRLQAAAEGVGVTPFILFGGTRVLAHPSLAKTGGQGYSGSRRRAAGPVSLVSKGSPLPGLSDVSDPFLAKMWSPDEINLPFLRGQKNSKMRAVQVGAERHIFVYREISRYGARPWIVGAHFDVQLAREEVMRLFLLGALGMGVLLIAVGGALLLSRITGRPVRLLAVAASQVESGDLDSVVPLQPTVLRELDEAATAFNRMIQGLRERNLIRDLFGRYVPEAVANALVRDHGGLTPQSAVATVLFTDLAGFTAMSEKLEPSAIVEVLNSFFSAMVEIIEGHGGVVTQFQGDAILAIFNVPVADPDHARKAVQAAIDMQRTVAAQTFAGQRLSCRIGINTGELVAGSVGASGRLSYTVHGDAVNIAARLEQLNKDYGTQTLISGATAACVEGFPLRAMGAVPVRGKAERVALYAIETTDENPDFLTTF